MTHICVSNLTTIGLDNGLSPDRCQAITSASAGILLIGPLGINFSEILIEMLYQQIYRCQYLRFLRVYIKIRMIQDSHSVAD